MYQAKVSVRNLVEFIMREGDLDNTRGGVRDVDAMQEGSRIHRKIQKAMPAGYQAEVPLSGSFLLIAPEERDGRAAPGHADGKEPVFVEAPETSVPCASRASVPTGAPEASVLAAAPEVSVPCASQALIPAAAREAAVVPDTSAADVPCGGERPGQEPLMFELTVEGRADGILTEPGRVMIDEIKGVYLDLDHLTEPVPVHLAQAKCYAYLYLRGKHGEREVLAAQDPDLSLIGVQLTYCSLETEEIKRFSVACGYGELEGWFFGLVGEYGKWVAWQALHNEKRNASIRSLEFPFPYRNGQKELVSGVYRTILRKKKVFIEAPTGVGKTISTVFPAMKAMGEGVAEKVFYLTAKTITRTVAEQTFDLLAERGMKTLTVTITGKEKLCVLERSDCNPAACERAAGHYDRVNEAVFDLLLHEERVDRERILAYAKKHKVCPFEMCLDTATWADAVIGDYNYAFDPNVYLRRFFEADGRDYVFLVDEAHNLVERARQMYSAVLVKEDFLEVKRAVSERSRNLAAKVEACNRDLLQYKRECEDILLLSYLSEFPMHLERALAAYEEFLEENRMFDGREQVLNLYFDIRHFLNMYERLDENYQIYAEHTENGRFALHLACMDPSVNLKACLKKGRSAVFFSATLLPIRYYKEQLGGEEDDYAVYAPSPFEPEKRLVLIGRDVSTRYSRRTQDGYERVADYLMAMAAGKQGNYMAFFPSYQYMEEVAGCVEERIGRYFPDAGSIRLLMQASGMNEEEKEIFLRAFEENSGRTLLAFCVMGGIFGEGIDLTGERLIGAAVVGTGIPMVCRERELFRDYYEETKQAGFEYAYLYGGMNKVLQSAGRVIRTTEDRGVILLLDDRFLRPDHQKLFPREWYPFEAITRKGLEERLESFWKG